MSRGTAGRHVVCGFPIFGDQPFWSSAPVICDALCLRGVIASVQVWLGLFV